VKGKEEMRLKEGRKMGEKKKEGELFMSRDGGKWTT
jgi:hypothetical protein